MTTLMQEISLYIWFWPKDLVRAWKYSPHAKHSKRVESQIGRIWSQLSW